MMLLKNCSFSSLNNISHFHFLCPIKLFLLAASLKCTNIWITNFLKRYGFSPTLTSCDGPVFHDYQIWIDLLRKCITQYKHEDFFCVDQFSMLPNIAPERISSMIQKSNLSKNTSNPEKISIVLCCNSNGSEKLHLLISGRKK